MYRIHTSLCSLREHLTWKRDSADLDNEETSEMPSESSNESCPISEEESKKPFGIGDGDDSIIDTLDTDPPAHFVPPELSTRERIQNNIFRLISARKKPVQDMEKLQMSLMYPPRTMQLNPIVELDEQAPEALNECDIITVQKTKSLVESAMEKTMINVTRLKSIWEESTGKGIDNAKAYANGIYWVCYAAPATGHDVTVLDEYDPYTKNESIRTNLVIAISMFIITAVANFFFKRMSKFIAFFESAAGMFTFFLVLGALLAMHFAMFLLPRTRKVPVNFICLAIIVLTTSVLTSFLSAKFKTFIILCIMIVVSISGIVHVFLATSRFDFRRFYLLFITTATAVCGTIVVSGIAFILKWFDNALQVMWLLILGIAISVCLAMELTLIAQMKTLHLSDEDYCLGGYILYMSSVDIFVRIVQILIRLDRY